MDKFYKLVNKNFRYDSSNKMKNGIISLKGGDLDEELKDFNKKNIYDIDEYFNYEFFQTRSHELDQIFLIIIQENTVLLVHYPKK